jgi:hypothetical protein
MTIESDRVHSSEVLSTAYRRRFLRAEEIQRRSALHYYGIIIIVRSDVYYVG